MKWLLILTFLITSCHPRKADEPDLYLITISVSDMDKSYKWYQNFLGFSLKAGNYEQIKRDFHQINLVRANLEIALLQEDSSISRKDIANSYSKSVQGFVQIGFHVSDFEKWENSLKAQKVQIVGNIIYDAFSAKRTLLITDPDNNMIYISER